jgi:hypothetical protein
MVKLQKILLASLFVTVFTIFFASPVSAADFALTTLTPGNIYTTSVNVVADSITLAGTTTNGNLQNSDFGYTAEIYNNQTNVLLHTFGCNITKSSSYNVNMGGYYSVNSQIIFPAPVTFLTGIEYRIELTQNCPSKTAIILNCYPLAAVCPFMGGSPNLTGIEGSIDSIVVTVNSTLPVYTNFEYPVNVDYSNIESFEPTYLCTYLGFDNSILTNQYLLVPFQTEKTVFTPLYFRSGTVNAKFVFRDSPCNVFALNELEHIETFDVLTNAVNTSYFTTNDADNFIDYEQVVTFNYDLSFDYYGTITDIEFYDGISYTEPLISTSGSIIHTFFVPTDRFSVIPTLSFNSSLFAERQTLYRSLGVGTAYIWYAGNDYSLLPEPRYENPILIDNLYFQFSVQNQVANINDDVILNAYLPVDSCGITDLHFYKDLSKPDYEVIPSILIPSVSRKLSITTTYSEEGEYKPMLKINYDCPNYTSARYLYLGSNSLNSAGFVRILNTDSPCITDPLPYTGGIYQYCIQFMSAIGDMNPLGLDAFFDSIMYKLLKFSSYYMNKMFGLDIMIFFSDIVSPPSQYITGVNSLLGNETAYLPENYLLQRRAYNTSTFDHVISMFITLVFIALIFKSLITIITTRK